MLPEATCDVTTGRTLMLREVAVVEARRADSWVVHGVFCFCALIL